MTHKYFNFSDVLGYGWRVMKANFWFFVGLGFLFLIITYTPTLVYLVLDKLGLSKPLFGILYIVNTILSYVINTILSIGIIKVALSFCDEINPPIGTLFNAWDCFWRYLGTLVLYGLIVLGGLILLIIPGIVWAIKFGFCFYFVVDKGLGPVNALKASALTTKTVKWQLLGFGIVCGAINILGLLCLLVGTFATYPVVIVASALVYRQLAAQTPELEKFGINTPKPNPIPL